jgi:hypothetical protein
MWPLFTPSHVTVAAFARDRALLFFVRVWWWWWCGGGGAAGSGVITYSDMAAGVLSDEYKVRHPSRGPGDARGAPPRPVNGGGGRPWQCQRQGPARALPRLQRLLHAALVCACARLCVCVRVRMLVRARLPQGKTWAAVRDEEAREKARTLKAAFDPTVTTIPPSLAAVREERGIGQVCARPPTRVRCPPSCVLACVCL